jgi:hypothetical protein
MRAITVLSVILFHGFLEQILGGFIGVDVFFVIQRREFDEELYRDWWNS